MPSNNLYIGLMSGTSADGIDAALVDFSDSSIKLVAHTEISLCDKLKKQIVELCQPGADEIDRMGALDRRLGYEFAAACNQLLAAAEVSAAQVTAIGSHGQTLRHRPEADREHSFTLQIGDPNTIAHLTGICTVSDFRRRDLAAGGQGAPLAPAFHCAAFHSAHTTRAIVNIGGMSNISFLPKDGEVIGFDTGPGNVLLDAWIYQNQQKQYDKDGNWAAKGQCNDDLLAQLLSHPYFQQRAPKSTGREVFNVDWLLEQIQTQITPIDAADIQATLLELTCATIANDILALCPKDETIEVYICGGGAYNKQLMKQLSARLEKHLVATTSALGIDPEWIEAVAFAWLAKQTIDRKPGNLPSVTGATQPVPLGGIYIAS